MSGANQAVFSPTEQQYVLQCKIIVFNKGYVNWKGQQLEDTMVLLVPKDCSEAWQFYFAWLPEDPSDNGKIEVPMLVRFPTFISPCRGSVLTFMEDIYPSACIFVMSKICEDALIELKRRLETEGRADDFFVDVVVMGEQNDTGDQGITDSSRY